MFIFVVLLCSVTVSQCLPSPVEEFVTTTSKPEEDGEKSFDCGYLSPLNIAAKPRNYSVPNYIRNSFKRTYTCLRTGNITETDLVMQMSVKETFLRFEVQTAPLHDMTRALLTMVLNPVGSANSTNIEQPLVTVMGSISPSSVVCSIPGVQINSKPNELHYNPLELLNSAWTRVTSSEVEERVTILFTVRREYNVTPNEEIPAILNTTAHVPSLRIFYA